jgi:hypothetical protein
MSVECMQSNLRSLWAASAVAVYSASCVKTEPTDGCVQAHKQWQAALVALLLSTARKVYQQGKCSDVIGDAAQVRVHMSAQ